MAGGRADKKTWSTSVDASRRTAGRRGESVFVRPKRQADSAVGCSCFGSKGVGDGDGDGGERGKREGKRRGKKRRKKREREGSTDVTRDWLLPLHTPPDAGQSRFKSK